MGSRRTEYQKLIEKYQAEIVALEEAEEDLKRRIGVLEELVPQVMVWYMWKVSHSGKPLTGSEDEARERLLHLEMLLEELKQTDLKLKDEERLMRENIEELKAKIDSYPAYEYLDKTQIPYKERVVDTKKDFREDVLLDNEDNEARFKELLQDPETDWQSTCKELFKNIGSLSKALQESNDRLKMSENHIKQLEKDYTEKEKKVIKKVDDLEKQHDDLYRESVTKEQDTIEEDEFEKEVLSIVTDVVEEVKLIKTSLTEKMQKEATIEEEATLLSITKVDKEEEIASLKSSIKDSSLPPKLVSPEDILPTESKKESAELLISPPLIFEKHESIQDTGLDIEKAMEEGIEDTSSATNKIRTGPTETEQRRLSHIEETKGLVAKPEEKTTSEISTIKPAEGLLESDTNDLPQELPGKQMEREIAEPDGTKSISSIQHTYVPLDDQETKRSVESGHLSDVGEITEAKPSLGNLDISIEKQPLLLGADIVLSEESQGQPSAIKSDVADENQPLQQESDIIYFPKEIQPDENVTATSDIQETDTISLPKEIQPDENVTATSDIQETDTISLPKEIQPDENVTATTDIQETDTISLPKEIQPDENVTATSDIQETDTISLPKEIQPDESVTATSDIQETDAISLPKEIQPDKNVTATSDISEDQQQFVQYTDVSSLSNKSQTLSVKTNIVYEVQPMQQEGEVIAPEKQEPIEHERDELPITTEKDIPEDGAKSPSLLAETLETDDRVKEDQVSSVGKTTPRISKAAAEVTEALSIMSEPLDIPSSGALVQPTDSERDLQQQLTVLKGKPSADSLAAKTLQGKCRIKDHLIKSMADQLRELARKNVWAGNILIDNMSSDPVKTYDFDRTTLFKYLKGEEPQNFAVTLESNESYSTKNPLNVKLLKQLDKDSLLIEWGPSPSQEVVGFQIFVNGVFMYWVYSAARNKALLHPLDLSTEFDITVSPVNVDGDIVYSSSMKYNPQ